MKRIFSLVLTCVLMTILSSCSKPDIQQFIYAGSSVGDYTTSETIDPPASLLFEYPTSESVYTLDFDDDGEVDITFKFTGDASSGHSRINMNVISAEDYEICTGSATNLAAQIAQGDIIDENRGWSGEELILHLYSYVAGESVILTGDWVKNGVNYVGFRKESGKYFQYGWVKITMESGSIWTIDGYAFITE